MSPPAAAACLLAGREGKELFLPEVADLEGGAGRGEAASFAACAKQYQLLPLTRLQQGTCAQPSLHFSAAR